MYNALIGSRWKTFLIVVSILLSITEISKAQNTGIGTTAPDRPLHIKGTGELLRLQGNFPWIGFMNNSDASYNGFIYYPDTSLVMGSRSGTNQPLVIAPNNTGLLYATAAQRVGIGVPAPTEKLDVNGSINLTGTIKANGVEGSSGQVLMQNSSGGLAWGDLSEFKNMATFRSGTGLSWAIPVGTKRVWVELWGGGASGITEIGGAGGAYLSAIVDILDPSSPGSMTFTVGAGGSGGIAGGPTLAGGNTTVSYTNPIGLTLSANGATAPIVTISPPVIQGGSSGFYTVTPSSFLNFYGVNGRYGTGQVSQILVSGTTTFENITYGDGGDGGNAAYTGGNGGQMLVNVTSSFLVRRTSSGGAGRQPGGGGSSGGSPISASIATVTGAAGGAGMVIFHY